MKFHQRSRRVAGLDVCSGNGEWACPTVGLHAARRLFCCDSLVKASTSHTAFQIPLRVISNDSSIDKAAQIELLRSEVGHYGALINT